MHPETNTFQPSTSVPENRPLKLIFDIVRQERRNIKYLYVYAIFSGLISLAIPLGIQTIIGYVMAGRLNTSWFLLSVIITFCVLLAGLTKLAQLSIIDSVQRKLFIFFGEKYKDQLIKLKANTREVPANLEARVGYFMDVVTLQKSLSKLLVDFTGKLLQAFFGLLLLSIYHPLFLTFGLVVMVVVIIVLRFTWKRGFETARIESNYKFKTAEALRTLFKVQDRKTLPEIEDQIDYNINQYSEARTQHFGILYRQAWLGIITKVIFTAFMLLIGSYLLVTQKISLGQFLAAEILIITLLDAVEKLILTVENLYDCGISAEKLNVISTIDDTI
jgi:ABC-type bacteriocin/lantibiotic exporter with double-glycine peptidase domain